MRLSNEIVFCLVAKVILLSLLWWVCFSHPVSPQASHQGLQHIFTNSHENTYARSS